MPPPPLPLPISLPIEPYRMPLVRIQYRDGFGADDATPTISSDEWTTLEYLGDVNSQQGAELLRFKRTALPEVGSAEFRFLFGTFPALIPGDPVVVPPDLKKMTVKIQMKIDEEDEWVTQFWGTVFDQEDIAMPGAGATSDTGGNPYRNGARIYRVTDGLWRTTKWMMSQSGFVGGGGGYAFEVKFTNAYFNPGYNYYDATHGAIFGNKHPETTYENKGIDIPCHIWQGAYSLVGAATPTLAGNKWTEAEMVAHASAANRPPGEPWFQLRGDGAGQYGYATSQPVRMDMSVFEFYSRILSRRRGLGVVFLDWVDIGDTIDVYLTVCPLSFADIVYDSPVFGATNPYTILGADSCGRSYQGLLGDKIFNLLGDHRNVDGTFTQSDATVNVHDYVETIGERIEIAVTTCLYDGAEDDASLWVSQSYAMEPRYSNSDLSSFVALDIVQRLNMRRYAHVFNLFGLPRGWLGKAGNGFNTDTHRVDARCDDFGTIFMPGELGNTIPVDTPSGYVELVGSLPFFEYYKYNGTSDKPEKNDNAEEYGLPSRRPLQIYLRPDGVDFDNPGTVSPGGDYWYLPAGQWAQGDDKSFGNLTSQGPMTKYQPTVTVAPDALFLDNQFDTEQGTRMCSDPAVDVGRSDDKKLYSIFPMSRVAISLTLRLPYPVRFCTTTVTGVRAGYPSSMKDRSLAERTKTLYVPGMHLWLAASNCIWDLEQSSYVTDRGFVPLRNALDSTPGSPAVLRDDRYLLQRFHEISANWYMTPRRRISITKRFCALFPYKTFGVDVLDPKIGELIPYMAADGQVQEVNTVVTSQEYDHQLGATNTLTDYFDLELG